MSSPGRNGTNALDERSVVAREQYDAERGDPVNAVLQVLDGLPEFDTESTDHVLADSVDPDALGSPFRSADGLSRTDGRAVFSIGGYEVTVTAVGEILVRDRG